MKRFAVAAIIPLFATFLYAQQTTTETHSSTTKTSTLNGTLIDAGCHTTHTEHSETSTGPEGSTSRKDSSRTVNCPVTTTTTSFGLMTADGHYYSFDQPSNTKITEIVRSNHTWNQDLNDRRPIDVRVVGTPNGDMVMMQSMSPVAVEGEAARTVPGQPTNVTVENETMFDATYNGDHGKLVIGPDRISWQDLSNANRSRTWNYAAIKELKRDPNDNAVKIEPYNGGERKFKISGPFMDDAVYNMIANRILAARPH